MRCDTVPKVARAIRELVVRGAPAIGVAAAYGLAVAAFRSRARSAPGMWVDLGRAADVLGGTRPTAVNLAWAIERVLGADRLGEAATPAALRPAVLAEARGRGAWEQASCRTLGRLGAALVPDGANVLTHCNAGALATAGYGTALGVIRAAVEDAKRDHVWVDETRPVLQGARLTAWELTRAGIPHTLVVDGAAASLFARGLVDLAVVGADRIATNGDVANKIGTYGVALAARAHDVPFFVAAPTSTIDLACPSGEAIEIEERAADEVVRPCGRRAVAPSGVRVANPAFDVTPSRLVTAVVTEAGVARRPYRPSLRRLAGG